MFAHAGLRRGGLLGPPPVLSAASTRWASATRKADRGASPTSRARLRGWEKAGTPLVEVEASLFSDPAPETMSGNPDVNFNEERAMVIAADYPCDSSPSTGLNTSQERGNNR
jgi:hypothetical protein